MKRNAVLTSTLGAIIALGLMAQGCSSTSNSGTGGAGGGSSSVGGHLGSVGGALGSQGGSNGQGGASADAGQDAGPMMCSPAPAEGAACNNNPPCNKNCGLNIMALSTVRAQKTCTCAGTWSCGACVYPSDLAAACFHIPASPPACPRDSTDGGADAGGGLIKPGVTACTPPNSEVCGNLCGSAVANMPSYQDSTGAGKVGYCVCIAGAWQCASVAEWPPQ
jgi:hypothetical protein